MLSPKRTLYRKFQKGKKKKKIRTCHNDILQFGRFGIKALSGGILHSNTISAVRRVLSRKLKRSGQIWIRVFPDIAVSEKPVAVRMGKGKGNPSYWICKVRPGQILFEMDGISLTLAEQAAQLSCNKLPMKIQFVVAD